MVTVKAEGSQQVSCMALILVPDALFLPVSQYQARSCFVSFKGNCNAG